MTDKMTITETPLRVLQAAASADATDNRSRVLIFPWDQRERFQAYAIARGGSGDASAAFDDPGAAGMSYGDKSLGRYPRNYTTGKERDGATIALYCFTRGGEQVRLTGIPFGTPTVDDLAADKSHALNYAYYYLSKCGIRLNDMTPEERAQAGQVILDWQDYVARTAGEDCRLLSHAEVKLVVQALSAWLSDDNDAPEEAEVLRKRLER